MFNRSAASRLSGWILLCFIYYLAAAASYGGFFLKWKFSEGEAYSFSKMVDGDAKRPFVYRQLLPMVANEVDKLTPSRIKKAFWAKLQSKPPYSNPIHGYFPFAAESDNAAYALRYYLVYAMSFLAMFAAMFTMRRVCIDFIRDRVAATLTPLVIALIYPLILTQGGYFYDMPELLFMSLGLLFASRGRVIALALVTVLGTWNKESYAIFVITLIPLLLTRFSLRRAGVIAVSLLIIASVVNVLIKIKYVNNSGSVVEYQLADHVKYLLSPKPYTRVEINYGVPTTAGFNVIHLVLLVIVVRTGWRRLPAAIRRHAWSATIITIPLFIAVCYRDELRNLSLLAMTLVLLVCANISVALRRAEESAGNKASSISTFNTAIDESRASSP